MLNEFGKNLPSWVRIVDPENIHYQAILEISVDKGEASAIALAIEYDNSLLIIDDSKGRKLAQQLGLTITGTLGVLVYAKSEGHISALKPILAKIRQTNFRLSEKIETQILKKAGE